jgi:rare lipoprotein A (peptidoglycan hydrolase)
VTATTSRWTVPIALAVDESATTTPTTTTTNTTTPIVPSATTAAVIGDARVTTTTTSTTTTTTTTTTPSPPAWEVEESGLASWYPEARDGYCASPYLSFGTVVTVTDMATGASIQCRVDDRQARNPGRVVDLSYDGFAELGRPSLGLIEVRLTW